MLLDRLSESEIYAIRGSQERIWDLATEAATTIRQQLEANLELSPVDKYWANQQLARFNDFMDQLTETGFFCRVTDQEIIGQKLFVSWYLHSVAYESACSYRTLRWCNTVGHVIDRKKLDKYL
ncbi:hypothetical protein BO94DRAFT_587245 [Aspergillus sclerotioniger CBS 115572]|uniref:Uncharacterized protein n=1 Tax=Aspergillus sclerotioniger CBS 115572 TaxID=1450535 RepID=A0A317W4M9_9EURO|nr:hypothetical protein BO94DRAFT_587245 [Aspergillus sclerotioniger CBS 115572]PWY81534.1 hypothetical protein BO94DRAFT_587245 [Aspergillus sclerotioniger CBS 115572]